MICVCRLLLSAVFIWEERITKARLRPDSKSTDFFFFNQPCIHSHLWDISAHLTSGLPDIFSLSSPSSHSISFKLHSPACSDRVLNSQATDTLPTLAMKDAICFRGKWEVPSAQTHDGELSEGARKWGKGKPGIKQNVWKELVRQLRNWTLVNCLGMVVGTGETDEHKPHVLVEWSRKLFNKQPIR